MDRAWPLKQGANIPIGSRSEANIKKELMLSMRRFCYGFQRLSLATHLVKLSFHCKWSLASYAEYDEYIGTLYLELYLLFLMQASMEQDHGRPTTPTPRYPSILENGNIEPCFYDVTYYPWEPQIWVHPELLEIMNGVAETQLEEVAPLAAGFLKNKPYDHRISEVQSLLQEIRSIAKHSHDQLVTMNATERAPEAVQRIQLIWYLRGAVRVIDVGSKRFCEGVLLNFKIIGSMYSLVIQLDRNRVVYAHVLASDWRGGKVEIEFLNTEEELSLLRSIEWMDRAK